MVERVRRHKSDLAIWILTFILLAIGLIIIYAIGPMRVNILNSTYNSGFDSQYFFYHQLINTGATIATLLIAYKLAKYDFLKKYSKWILIFGYSLSVILWIATLAGLPLAKCELGECRWLNIAGISVQPSEVLKLCLILYLAGYLARKKEEGVIGKLRDFWVPLFITCGIALGLVVVVQGDLGTGISLFVIILGMLLVAGVPVWQVLIGLGIAAVVGVGAVLTSAHRMGRVSSWWTLLTGGEGSDSTYHIENALLAIGSGGFFGVGIGNSVQATGYLPESINDSIFAILGETFGFLGLMIIVALFFVLLSRIMKVAEQTSELDKRLVVVGVFSWIASQVVINIMAMTGLVPVTGITLPLLSYGGTSMAVIGFAIGLVLQLSCYTGREVNHNHENISSRRRERGTRNTSSSRRS